MALQKTITTNIGADATYHVASAIHIIPSIPIGAQDGQGGMSTGALVRVDVNSYLSADAYQTGKAPIQLFQFTFPDTIFTGSALPIDDVYTAIKTTTMFAGATEI